MSRIQNLIDQLGEMPFETNPRLIAQKSRDFYWYSPVLKRQLDHVIGDLVVCPRSEDEIMKLLSLCYRLDIPVTPRGGGTGNYGQSMPLSGGVVMDLRQLNRIGEIRTGSVVVEPGVLIHDIDVETRSHSGQELRLHPSTAKTATIGGFIAGGSGGVGSIRWGILSDPGNIIRLRVVTMEENPRVLELQGNDLLKVVHAYGTNGIITELELPLAPAYDWIDILIADEDWGRLNHFANHLAHLDALLIKELATIQAPVPFDCFTRHKPWLEPGQSVLITMVAPHALSTLLAQCETHGIRIAFRSDQVSTEQREKLPPVYELAWNHATLRALRLDPSITYLQVLYPNPVHVEKIIEMSTLFGREVPGHAEFMRFGGKVSCDGIPLLRYTTEERLDEIIRLHEVHGCPVFNPHRYTLEEGGMKETDPLQLAFKKEVDPKGLLNPGKMIAWDDPDYDFSSGQTYLFPGLAMKG